MVKYKAQFDEGRNMENVSKVIIGKNFIVMLAVMFAVLASSLSFILMVSSPSPRRGGRVSPG